MLKQRILTALVLLSLLIPALFYPSTHAFFALMLLLVTAGAWEWGRLNGLNTGTAVLMGGLCSLVCLAAWLSGLPQLRLPWLWAFSGIVWTSAAIAMLLGGVSSWLRVPQFLRLGAGLAALSLAWLAVAQARLIGINFLLSVFLLVWAADIFAYFAGRRFGARLFSRRLAPTISPGKSWEGVCGGLLGVLLLAAVWIWADERWAGSGLSLYSQLFTQGPVVLLFALVFLIAMSVVGDLLESLIKRSAGAKDSSNLLPGHGGVLDRVDALLPVLPLAMMWHSLLNK